MPGTLCERRTRFARSFLSPMLALSCVLLTAEVGAQAVGTPAVPAQGAAAALPEEPGSRGTVVGQITDPSGALVPGARVLLRLPGRRHEMEATSDEQGRFTFTGLTAGEYSFVVAATNFNEYESLPFSLAVGESRELAAVALSIPAGHADAYVTANRKEIAAAEVHAAEQQRVLFFPDFYTSFVWDAAPMDAGQKFNLGLHAALDPMAFVTAGLTAGAEQINGTFKGFGPGPEGYGKRYGAAYADAFVGKVIGAALLPSVFRQDPRYFYMGPNAPVSRRVRHALLSGVLTRGDNGKLQPNYSHIAGNAAAGAISALYHPHENPGTLAGRNALLGSVGTAGVNLVREFVLKRFVHGGDVDAGGLPAGKAAAPAAKERE